MLRLGAIGLLLVMWALALAVSKRRIPRAKNKAIRRRLSVYTYPELLTSPEWRSARAAFEAAAAMTGTSFDVVTDFEVRNDGVVISPWGRDAPASNFAASPRRNSAALAFAMCAHGSLLPGGIRSPSSYDGCAAAAADAAESEWGEWTPEAVVAVTHAGTDRWRSVAEAFSARVGSPALSVVTGCAEARRVVAAGEHDSYALVVFGTDAIETVLENRSWFLSRKAKCVYIGEVDDHLAATLRDNAVPFAEHRVYSDCFVAYCFALNSPDLLKHRPLPLRETTATRPARASPWRHVGCAVVAAGRDISTWDQYGRKARGEQCKYYDAKGTARTREIDDSAARGSLSGTFVRYRLMERALPGARRSYAVQTPEMQTLPPLPPLREGDVFEIPGTFEHAQVHLFE